MRLTADRDGTRSRPAALARIGALYLVVQVLSYVVLQSSCAPSSVDNFWVHGALGPLAAVKAIPRFQYHASLRNAMFAGWCLLVLAAPFVHVLRPARKTLIVSAVALVVWCLFGLGFTIDHM